MKPTKFVAVLLIAAAGSLTACHSTKKTSYIGRFHKEARQDAGFAKIRLKGDTVRVIYPEVAMFDFNKSDIKPAAQTTLKRFAAILARYDRIDFTINGYTDNVGTDEVNHTLSKERAESAKNLFVANAISNNRITTHGLGSAHPIETNDTESGRQANRRVELLLYERR